MQKRASILLVTSWILSLLVVFAISMGFRARIALKLSSYQKDNLAAGFLAGAGINLARYELKKDANEYDSFTDSWADNEKMFSKISPDGSEKEYAAVYYIDNAGEKMYGVKDEQGKIDINNSGSKVIEELFASKGLAVDAKELSKLVKEWTSSSVEAAEEKKMFKNSHLSANEELILVLEYFYKDKLKAQEVYKMLEDSFTVYSSGKLNINTASKETLLILARAYAEGEEETAAAEGLADAVVRLRDEKGFLKDIASVSFDASFGASELSLWGKIRSFLDVKSNYFRIHSRAWVKDATKEATAVLKRDTDEMVYWHQS